MGTGGPHSTTPQLLTQGAPLTPELPDSQERSPGKGRIWEGPRTLEIPEAHRACTTAAPNPPIALRSRHPGCLGEGAQEGEVAASASDYRMDGGRVSRPGSLQGSPRGIRPGGSSRIMTRLGYVSGCLCVRRVSFSPVPGGFSCTCVCLCLRLNACASHVGFHLSALGSLWLHCQASPLFQHLCGSCICFLALLMGLCLCVSVPVSNPFSDFAWVHLSGPK